MQATNLPAFLEHNLGPIQDGVSASTWGFQENVMAARFTGVPWPAANTYITLGLSKYELHAGSGHIRIELLVCANANDASQERAGLLHHLAHQCIETSDALTVDECFALPGRVFSNSAMTALLVTTPFLLDDSVAMFQPIRGDPIRLLMVTPIYETECEWIARHNVQQFIARLARLGEGILDVGRVALDSES